MGIGVLVGIGLLAAAAYGQRPGTAGPEGRETAQLRVVQLVRGSEATPLDLWIDDVLRFPAQGLRTVSRYVQLPAGERLLRVEPLSFPPIRLTLIPGRPHTAVLIGSLEMGIRAILVADEFPRVRAPDPEETRARLVYGIVPESSAPAVTVWLQGSEGTVQLAQGLHPGEAGAYVPVPPGTYAMEVVSADADPDPDPVRKGTRLLRVQGLSLGLQAYYTLILADLEGDGDGEDLPTALVVVRDRPNPPVPGVIWVGLGLWALLLARFVLQHLLPS